MNNSPKSINLRSCKNNFLLKHRLTVLLLISVLLLLAASASANSWGLKGPLYDYVSGQKAYADYSQIAFDYRSDCPTSAAVLQGRNHHLLLVSGTDANGKNTVWQSTTAVYQPDESAEAPHISCTANTVTLSWPASSETYVFTWDCNQPAAGAFVLTDAHKGTLQMHLEEGGKHYSVNDSLWWEVCPIRIEDFNVKLMPSAEADVQTANLIYALLGDASEFWHTDCSFSGETLPVYAFPGEGCFRAADGKAAVSPSEGFSLLAAADGWNLIEYEISPRAHRIGWIQSSKCPAAPVLFSELPVEGSAFLTDDPLCGQSVLAGEDRITDIHLLSLLNPFYAYASAGLDGRTLNGFVPVTVGKTSANFEPDPSLMEDLSGTWVFASGGNLTYDVLELHSDGVCLLSNQDSSAVLKGTWTILQGCIGGYERTLLFCTEGQTFALHIGNLNEERTVLMLCKGESGGTWVRSVSPAESSAADTPVFQPVGRGDGYDSLDEQLKSFFPQELWGKARFLTDGDWEADAQYSAENGLGIYRHYPVVTVLDGKLQVHLFEKTENGIAKITETRTDCVPSEADGYTAGLPIYHLSDGVGQFDGVYRYSEVLNLYLYRDQNPFSIQIELEDRDADPANGLCVNAVIYQFAEPQKTHIQGLPCDCIILNITEDGLTYGYSYLEEPVSDSLLVPLAGSTSLESFSLASFPDTPSALLTPSCVDTSRHGSGGAVNLRSEPGKQADILCQLPNGAQLDAAELKNGWCVVNYAGQYGYIMAEYIKGTAEWSK